MIPVVKVIITVIMGLAGLLKLANRQGFAETLTALQLPAPGVRLLTWMVPVAELLVAVGLLVPGASRYGALLLILLMLSFAVTAIRVIRSKTSVLCNCFGGLTPERFGWKTLVRIGIFLGLAVLLLFVDTSAAVTDLPPADIIAAVFSGLGLVLLDQLGTTLFMRSPLQAAGNPAHRKA